MKVLQRVNDLVPLQQSSRPILKCAQLYYNDFYAEKLKKKYTQKAHDFNLICKSGSSNIPITKNEQDVLANITNMIKRSPTGIGFISHEGLSTITHNNKRQNNIIRKNINHIICGKWRKAVKIDGILRRNVIIFSFTANGEAIINNPQEYYKKVKAGIRVPTSIYKYENKVIKNRSIAQARESTFCNNSRLDNSKVNNIPVETKELVSEEESVVEDTEFNKQSPAVVLKVDKFRRAERKKNTNSEIKSKKAKLLIEKKALKAQIIRPVFYHKPKTLADMYPLLDQGIYEDLRSGSGRDFSNNFISERVLAMSKKPNLFSRNFKTRKGFVTYMSLVLKYELYDAVKTGSIDFRIKANITENEKIALEQENFLAKVENSTCITPEWQFKKKLVSVLSSSQVYKLLQSYISLEIENDVLRMQLTETVELSELEREVILDQAKAVYENMSGEDIIFIEGLEFVVTESRTSKAKVSEINMPKDKPEENLPKGIWGEICKKLVAKYGVYVYRNWFSKLTAEFDEEVRTIEFKYPSQFVEDWISTNYEDSLRSVFAGFGMKFKEIN